MAFCRRKGLGEVRAPPFRGQPRLGRGVPAALEPLRPDRKPGQRSNGASKLLGLVVAANRHSPPTQRYRHQLGSVGIPQQRRRPQCEDLGQSPPPLILEAVYRVPDSWIEANGAANRAEVRRPFRTDPARKTQRRRFATLLAEWRWNGTPARPAHFADERVVRCRCATDRTLRRQQPAFNATAEFRPVDHRAPRA